MIEKRRHQRIDCATKCLLYMDESKYRGIVENISLSGALVKLYRNPHEVTHAGDSCSLLLCHLSVLTYSRFASQIVRSGPARIGLKFLF